MSEVLDFRQENQKAPGQRWRLTQPVFFVGFMGAGKTSVTRKLARIAGVAELDMDTYIERTASKKIPDIFKECGEEGFRAIETDVLRQLAEEEPRLISCGGGVIKLEDNREILRGGKLTVVYLQVTADEAASRISNLASRPLFGDINQARAVLEERLPLYDEVADIVVDTKERPAGAIAKEVFQLLKAQEILVPEA